MRIIFYGPEGSGKTTQAKNLAAKLGIPHLGSGDLVRRAAEFDKGMIGDTCREGLATGHYIADSEMFVMWKARLKDEDIQNGWVIDGFPRNLSQSEWLSDKFDKYDQVVDKVFFLDLSEEESIKRLLKRGRKNPDGAISDTEELIRERLRRYKREEKQVLSYYENLGVLEKIDGERSIEEIHEDILKRVRI